MYHHPHPAVSDLALDLGDAVPDFFRFFLYCLYKKEKVKI